MFDTSAAMSWHLYKMGQARLERQQLAGGHLTVGGQVFWQDNTQVNFFGIGPDVTDNDRSQYRLQSTDYVGYATGHHERVAVDQRRARVARASEADESRRHRFNRMCRARWSRFRTCRRRT
jgi:hypothetical protein